MYPRLTDFEGKNSGREEEVEAITHGMLASVMDNFIH
jgi:hypothetical protein